MNANWYGMQVQVLQQERERELERGWHAQHLRRHETDSRSGDEGHARAAVTGAVGALRGLFGGR